MIGTNKIKPLSIFSSYIAEYNDALIKDDKAMNVFGKSEEDDGIKDFWWDSVKKDLLPWRGGGIVTDKGQFYFCVYLGWWAKKEPTKLIDRLSTGDTLKTKQKTIYFWKAPNDSLRRKKIPEQLIELTERLPEKTLK